MLFENQFGKVVYHDTPWNSNAIDGNSLEIVSLAAEQSGLSGLISGFCEQKKNESYILIAARIPAIRNDLKKAYFESGFINVEHTLDVFVNGVDVIRLMDIRNRFPVLVEDFSIQNLSSIEDISGNEFNYGRFFEDPYIDLDSAKKRNRSWITDLISQKVKIRVLKKRDNVVGFMAYKINDNVAQLILGGIKQSYRHLAYGFWAEIILELSEVSEINTTISSSNTDVLNLYSYFGFRFGNARFGFHKHL